jgi:hypothetical protein
MVALRNLGLQVVLHAPAVGQGLQDHLAVNHYLLARADPER